MIKFFRKIRQGLLIENNPASPSHTGRQAAGRSRKYIIYAIGEIVLVVIGILIALSINNWNEGQKDKLKEQAILEQLQKEYKTNLIQLEAKMKLRTNIIQSGLTILQYMDTPENAPRDSLILQLSKIIFDPTFDPIQNDLISSGNIRLVRSDKLRHLLSNWSSDVIAVQETEQSNQLQVHEIMLPLFHEIGITRDVFNEVWRNVGDFYWLLDENSKTKKLTLGESPVAVSANEILTFKALEGVVSNTISINTIGNIESESLKNRINEILSLIDIELKIHDKR